ncbi:MULTISPECIES: AIPR family protein [Shewanella]|uniref:AIPR family protein n=1 Tax=Shewanella TaxID=22 RepID=UPI00217CF76A|nr:AIPR family protein [Shewanella baltica]MCS6177290.1 abortive phage infection protein [Shewanella baltica]MCS6253499.1 abortive phage infection protein [Shewanella baltica]
MHIILKKHMTDLVNDFELKEYEESKLFEMFCNFCIVSKKYFGRFNPKEVTTGGDDASIDGIAVIIDGELITKIDDAIEIFDTYKSNFNVDIIFTQVKSGELFRKDEISNFKLGVEDFLSLSPKLPNGEMNVECLGVFLVILDNLKKVRNRRPNGYFYYCTSGTYKAEKEINAALRILERDVKSSDIFNSVHVEALGRSEILNLWSDISEKNEAKVKLIDYFGMPQMPGIPQSYVGIVNAREFVNKILCDEDGYMKGGVFDENIRAFLGLENNVNSEISETINNEDKRKLFSVLNNGITIVSPEMTLTPNSKEIDITNYQIINGCQTSNTLYLLKDNLDDSVNVVVKFIESPDNLISTDIISATNSQSSISSESLHGLKQKAKLVQSYFMAKNSDALPENKIYFERRENEFKNNGYQSTRIFDVREVSRCFAAMFLNQPHNAARYVKLIFTASGDYLFKNEDHESLYYCSVLTLYKYNTLINGRKINAHNYIKLRWHIIQLFKWLVHRKVENIDVSSNKADKYAEKIIKTLNSPTKSYVNVFEECHSIIDSIEMPSDDELKRSKYAGLLFEAAKKYLEDNK